MFWSFNVSDESVHKMETKFSMKNYEIARKTELSHASICSAIMPIENWSESILLRVGVQHGRARQFNFREAITAGQSASAKWANFKGANKECTLYRVSRFR